ncbi:hypothetical protein [Litorimonas haliclonae]|uniref:hypothetical protein n=1 Tax=Litorimonas haliclonae TaxID=2081977 RepID=UPI0039F12ED9
MPDKIIISLIDYEITIEQREQARDALLRRKAELDVGMYKLQFFIARKLSIYRGRVLMEDGKLIYGGGVTARDLQNFVSGRRTTLAKLYPIIAYLAIVEYQRRTNADEQT